LQTYGYVGWVVSWHSPSPHVPGWHGLFVIIFCSQNVPVYPAGQLHKNALTKSKQMAPFLQGLESHSFISKIVI
jgi:hypothetical protein